ncbi:MAG: LptF/LptG family permease [Odoribacteraceae bacterium]|nr:LptF/LptG family permease [Odoribacteraceae bacterium]
MKKLDLYIIRKFLGTFFFSLGLILCIVIVFDISERLEKFLESKATLTEIVMDYYVNFVPYFANVFSALFTFISVIFFTSKMAYNSEIIAILSTGISFRRIVRPYIFSAAIIAALSLLLSAFVIPNANRKRNAFAEQHLNRKYQNQERNIHRQIAPGEYIYMSNLSTSSPIGFHFALEKFKGDTLVSKWTSDRVEWREDIKKWRVYKWKIREFAGDKQYYKTGDQLDTTLNFSFKEFTEDPKRVKENLTLPQLNEYIDRQKLRGSANVVEFQLEKYKMFANAFSTFVLTFIGVCIASKKIRGGMGFHLGLGLMISFSYILFMQFSTVFATNGDMNPMLAVWLPDILFTVVALFVYRFAPK